MCIPAGFWRYPEAVHALESRDVTRIVRLLRARTDLSQETIARLTGLSQAMVSQMEAGQRSLRDPAKKRRALEGLGAPQPQPPPQAESAASAMRPESASADTHFLRQHALSLSFTHGALAVSVENARALWQADITEELEIHRQPVSAEEVTTPVLRWLVAPLAVPKISSTGPVMVGGDHVAAVRRACQLFEALDHEFGGGHARIAAVQYLRSEVAPLLTGRYTAAVGRELFSATAHFSYKVGAMAYDAALHGLARRYFVQSLNFAHMASDTALAGKALALMSHQANFLGDYRSAVDFARSAKEGTRGAVTPGVYAMYSAMEARCLASLGEERECTAALAEMERGFERRDAQEPTWLDYFDEAEVHDEFAHCFHDLGHAQLAADHARTAADLTRREYRRSRTFAGLILAGSHLLGGHAGPDVEQACAVAEHTIAQAGTLRSARVHTYIHRFNNRLAPYTDTAAVQRFRAQSLPGFVPALPS